jgi:hypothetical protein
MGIGLAETVYCLNTDCRTGVRFPVAVKKFSSSLSVHAGSGAHPVSCAMGTGGPFPGAKARPGSDAVHSHTHQMQRSWMGRSYTCYPIWRLNSVKRDTLYIFNLFTPLSFLNETCRLMRSPSCLCVCLSPLPTSETTARYLRNSVGRSCHRRGPRGHNF